MPKQRRNELFLGLQESALEDHLGLIEAERLQAKKLDDMLKRLSDEVSDIDEIIAQTRESLKKVQDSISNRSVFLMDLRDKISQTIQWEESLFPQGTKDITLF